jgi:hypothetical protein
MNDKPVLTPEDVAERWSCSPDVVRAKMRGGLMPSFKIGPRLYRVRLNVLEAWELEQAS